MAYGCYNTQRTTPILYNRRHIQKSCGNADELEAKAMMRGAEGKAFRDEILDKYGELNPVVMKAQKFLDSLFASYDELGRKQSPDKWHQSSFNFNWSIKFVVSILN